MLVDADLLLTFRWRIASNRRLLVSGSMRH
jgi:hypothetical protein